MRVFFCRHLRLTGKPVGLFSFVCLVSYLFCLKAGSIISSMSRLRKLPEPLSLCGPLAQAVLVFLLAMAGGRVQAQALWNAVGPAGGDARAFGAVPGEPNHLYLGTTNSWIY